jgi:hypothetical protein
MKTERAESRSVSQRNGSEDLDPHQYVRDPEDIKKLKLGPQKIKTVTTILLCPSSYYEVTTLKKEGRAMIKARGTANLGMREK